MHPTYRVLCMGAAAMIAGLAACSSDGTTSPDQLVADSAITSGIANDVGDAMATSVDLMTSDEQSDSVNGSLGVPAPGLTMDVNRTVDTNCSGPDGDGWSLHGSVPPPRDGRRRSTTPEGWCPGPRRGREPADGA